MNDKSQTFFIFLLFISLVISIAIAWDVYIVRQLIGFIFLSFVPGSIIIGFFKLKQINLIEIILFSVGLSIAFLMFVGLIINEVYPFFGIFDPLSSHSIIITIIGIVAALTSLVYVFNINLPNQISVLFKFQKRTFLLIFLPIISVIGAIFMNSYGNNLLSLLVICTISGLIILSVFSKKIISPKYYPITLLIIAISLLFLFSFASMYIIGYDIPLEYYVFKLTKTSFHWVKLIPSAPLVALNYNSMLSITILPTIYSNVLNMSETWVFKLIYPSLYALTSLGLYQIYKKQFDDRVAFLSTFFFISFNAFYDVMLGLTRQMIGELFLIILILLMFEEKLSGSKKFALSIIFSAALIVSHYSISYILILLLFVTLPFLSRIHNEKKIQSNVLSWSFFLLFLILTFSWYGYISSSPMVTLTTMIQNLYESFFVDFLNPASRSSSVIEVVALGSSATLIRTIGKAVFQIAQFFIVIGILNLIIKRREINISKGYYFMSLTSMALLLLSILMPYFSSSLEMSRIYHIALIFLAPFFILGSVKLCEFFKIKRIAFPLISIFLIVFFLFQSGFIYEISGDIPTAGALSKYRMDPQTNLALYVQYIHEQEVYSVNWISHNGVVPKVYSDRTSQYHALLSYGMLPAEYQHNWAYLLSNNTNNVPQDAYIYLGTLNVVESLAEGPSPGQLWNITEISPFLDSCNKIYSNGGSDIYKPVS